MTPGPRSSFAQGPIFALALVLAIVLAGPAVSAQTPPESCDLCAQRTAAAERTLLDAVLGGWVSASVDGSSFSIET